ncbi:MAG: hypothetical protein KatS3mg048_2421 [Caldilinea sp.]|nr:hypothetical protein [Caldilinea sp.]GIV69559.1 MAG: hypothetical protein KatS3mg048_2421 [Caldilinea sp.]
MSRPNVQGIAVARSWITGVGKEESDGPKSPRSRRPQKARYCSHTLPDRPYISVSASRMAMIASGLTCEPLIISWLTCRSTGSLGERRGMINVNVTPRKITKMYCAMRGTR